MLTDKELKVKYKGEFSRNFDKYYPTETIKALGFARRKCKKCGKSFWSMDERNFCGDSLCSGGYDFIGNTPAKNKIDYIDVWKNFSSLLEKRGYTPVKRYPVAARWRDDIPFVEASVDAFIPSVVNGISDPPANPLTIPQPCLRFNDIDNVGITGAHYSLFVMIGQHAFVEPKKYDVNRYFEDLLVWFLRGMKIGSHELVFHEDTWAGSGNFGPCMEIFSRGLELANQVYMQYAQTGSGFRDLNLKVLDMGLGQERNAWFSAGSSTSYETTFPTVCSKLKKMAGIKVDETVIKKFLSYSGMLNMDEMKNVEKTWKFIADKIGIGVEELKENVLPATAIYAISEHTRALLVAITDGALPSNVGGGYNLRVLLRRIFSFTSSLGYGIDLTSVAEAHAKYLKPVFPELAEGIGSFYEIVEAERMRFEESRSRGRSIVEKNLKKKIGLEKLIEMYESNGITPEMVSEIAMKNGIKVSVPEDFYARISEKHSAKKIQADYYVLDVPDTEILYHGQDKEFIAKVIRTDGEKVFLDRTAFYPTSGGQEHDEGTLNGKHVYDVQKCGNVIIHFVKGHNFKSGQQIDGKIDYKKREQLASHHTAAHIINAAARKILGRHVYQAGSGKTAEKAHLDVTHYKGLATNEVDEIEKEANKIVNKALPISKTVMERGEAEKRFGMNIYQGGAVPGKKLRIVEIKGIDVEACGGTHLDNTSDAGKIIITSTERIQDGIVRINFVSGKRAKNWKNEREKIEKECLKIVGAKKGELAKKSAELFERWKELRKKAEKGVQKKASEIVETLENKFEKNILIEKINGAGMKELQEISRKISMPGKVVILFGISDKTYVFGSSGKKDVDIGKLISRICEKLGGKGGGSAAMGQGVAKKDGVEKVIVELRKELIRNG
ncbi:MAG: alanine--tRNA ligase [Candidatus Aenigmarchaeota archaeon]|nr:alanine--tRNA ligase [Candidatus Aenigmarchaeota archaeon]